MPTNRAVRLYVTPTEFDLPMLLLEGERARRVLSVLRLPVGAPLRVFDGDGRERHATLEAATRTLATLRLGAPLAPLPEPRLRLTLCCAFPRGARGDWLVEKATELGVAAFAPLEADRAVMHAGDGRLDRWRRIAIEAAEQCGRATVPAFLDTPPLDALALVADLDVTRTPSEALAAASVASTVEALALYVGPEGGWSDDERAAHAAAGHVFVTLGPRTLRVETAAVALLTLSLAALEVRRSA
ncbi:MAG: RsmE family RNA methyltransferase [Dehalococcoidia bacterium]